ncbi:hypothetical protein [Polymorphobacter fuscus]|uniref:hypothetical protein n=1 Tax=Sandarakinorhabdus fusca TaxID=1439888 RepID=UPI00188429CE|nr:hypothetical protein [Polymorphobacter fuscus]
MAKLRDLAQLRLLILSMLFVPGHAMAAQVPASVQRIADAASRDATRLSALVLVCVVFGLFVLADRRRRSRVRQASA